MPALGIRRFPCVAARVLRAYYGGGELETVGRPALPAGLLGRLRAELAPGAAAVAVRQVAADGTARLLLRLGDATRVQLLPMGKRSAIPDVLAAANRFQAARGWPVTVQYCLLKGVNDSAARARTLAAVVSARRMHVNVLRYNPTGLSLCGLSDEPASDEAAEAFVAELRAHGVVAHFRRSRGPDIDAACGQLRRRVAEPTRAH